MAINRASVFAAFDTIRADGIGWNGPSTKWDVIDPNTGERFPPKAVLRIAKEISGDMSASAGGGWPTNDRLKALDFEIALKTHLEVSDEATDIRKIIQSDTDETTKQRLINARLGQGGFREALLEIWERTCPLTGCQIGPVLRASHIKAWRAATNVERLDPYNGLLLAASIDALFDRHLLTFTPAGSTLLAASLTKSQVINLGLKEGSTIKPGKLTFAYLDWHRSESERLTGALVPF